MNCVTLDDFQTADRYTPEVNLEPILVLDTETTGLNGGPRDAVVDIGISEVDLNAGTVKDVYSSIVGYDITGWSDSMCHSWIFENTDLTVEDVAAAKPFEIVKKEVLKIIRGRWLTTYNTKFDLDKFLYKEPWSIRPNTFLRCRDIMYSATEVCKLPPLDKRLDGHEYRFPRLDYAYEKILEGRDPAGIHGVQDHRALSDTRVAGHLMLELYRAGCYDPMDLAMRHGGRTERH